MNHQTTSQPAKQGISEKRAWLCPPDVMDSGFIDSSPSIVLADDNDRVRETAARALTSRGCRVRCAADGKQAWRLLCEAPFALLITDNEMPGLIGLELLRRMRAASFEQPAILMSGNMPWDALDLYELLSPGAALEKPFGADQLVTALCALAVFQPKSGRGTPHFGSERDRVNVKHERRFAPFRTFRPFFR